MDLRNASEEMAVSPTNIQLDSSGDPSGFVDDKENNKDKSNTIEEGGGSTTVVVKSDERKLGHRRVGTGGVVTFKKIQTSQIMDSIQLGIQLAVGGLASKPERDLLMQDFMTVEMTRFPPDGSHITPAHHCSEFLFKTYAPMAFRYFRDLFGIRPDDFLLSFCNAPLRELSNPGASGSIFYLTADDEFIVKTVQHKEGEFLQKLLPGYYMNLNQNPRTLLPKFFGLYCYQCNAKNIRIVAMNNLLPSTLVLHQKYDLKGSTYGRKASKSERQKKSPTYKDLDFIEHHPEGIFLELDTYTALVKTIQRDCRVLESFKIMDYSLLIGIHNLDQVSREKTEMAQKQVESTAPEDVPNPCNEFQAPNSLESTNCKTESETIDDTKDIPSGSIPARNAKGEKLLLFIGIIDILQSYNLKKKLEHTWKSIIHDGDTVSVHRPGYYADRFLSFMAKTVFRKIPTPLKHYPSKRKTINRGRPNDEPMFPTCSRLPHVLEREVRVSDREDHPRNPILTTSRFDFMHVQQKKGYHGPEITLDSHFEMRSSLSMESGSSTSGIGSIMTSNSRHLMWTPPTSIMGSTSTWTEGTPSLTESSLSGDVDNKLSTLV